jgi:hypothetical protein
MAGRRQAIAALVVLQVAAIGLVTEPLARSAPGCGDRSLAPRAVYSGPDGQDILIQLSGGTVCRSSDYTCSDVGRGLRDCSNASLKCAALDEIPLAVQTESLKTGTPYAVGVYDLYPTCLHYEAGTASECRIAVVIFRERDEPAARIRTTGFFDYQSDRGVTGFNIYYGDGLPDDPASYVYWRFTSGTPLLDPTWGSNDPVWCAEKAEASSVGER